MALAGSAAWTHCPSREGQQRQLAGGQGCGRRLNAPDMTAVLCGGARPTRGALVLEGVLDVLAGLLDVRAGLIGLALGFEALVAGHLSDGVLDLALGLLDGVLGLVGEAHESAFLASGEARKKLTSPPSSSWASRVCSSSSCAVWGSTNTCTLPSSMRASPGTGSVTSENSNPWLPGAMRSQALSGARGVRARTADRAWSVKVSTVAPALLEVLRAPPPSDGPRTMSNRAARPSACRGRRTIATRATLPWASWMPSTERRPGHSARRTRQPRRTELIVTIGSSLGLRPGSEVCPQEEVAATHPWVDRDRT